MYRDAAWTGAYTGILIGVLGLFAWVTGNPLVFPSLGPTAFLLARSREGPVVADRRVVGGHAIGVAAGLLAHHLVAPEAALSVSVPAYSTAMLRLAVAAALSVALTSVVMLLADANHPPACATTLIVSLGILPTVWTGVIIVGAVVALVAFHELAMKSAVVARRALEQSDAERI